MARHITQVSVPEQPHRRRGPAGEVRRVRAGRFHRSRWLRPAPARARRKLVAEGILGKLGCGVYVRLETSFIDGSHVMTSDFGGAVRQTLRRLGVPFDETDTVKDYNAGRTTQVQSTRCLSCRNASRGDCNSAI